MATRALAVPGSCCGNYGRAGDFGTAAQNEPTGNWDGRGNQRSTGWPPRVDAKCFRPAGSCSRVKWQSQATMTARPTLTGANAATIGPEPCRTEQHQPRG